MKVQHIIFFRFNKSFTNLTCSIGEFNFFDKIFSLEDLEIKKVNGSMEYEHNEIKLQKLCEEYSYIRTKLDDLQKAGEVSGLTKSAVCATK